MAIRSKCDCGKVKSKDATKCNSCHRAHMDSLHAKAQAIVSTGVCPQCGSKLERNLALTGWWQCGAHGEPYMRKPEFRALPHCSFQTFTK